MKVKAFITTSLCLLSGWLGLAYMHQVDMDSYTVKEADAPKLSQEKKEESTKNVAKLPHNEKLGTIVAE